MKKIFIISIFVIFSFCNSNSQGYKIRIEVKGAENKDVWLVYYYEDQYGTVEKLQFDEKGIVTFTGDKKLDGGIYLISIDQTGYFDFLVTEDQDFTLITDTTDFVLNMKVKGSEENSIFYEYQQEIAKKTIKKNELEKKKELTIDSTELKQIDVEISIINNYLSNSWKETSEKYPNSFLSILLKAMNTFEATDIDDPFGNVDFSEPKLIRTPFFYNIIRYHIATYIEAGSSKIIEENKKLLEKCTNDTVYQYVATYLLNFYRTFIKAGINEVFVDLADNHFLNGNGYWLDSTAVELISEQTEIFRASFIGQKAYDFKVLSTEGDSIQVLDFDTEFRFIFFWSIGCGHCEDAAKIVKQHREEIEAMNIDILGINTDIKQIENWKSYIEEQGFSWLQGVDIAENYRFKEYYYVASTPLLYVIDKNHIIANKMYGEDKIESFIKYILQNQE